MTALRCTRRGCDGRELVERSDRIGRITFECPECERVTARNAKGLCADCRRCAAIREGRRGADRQRKRFQRDKDIRDRKNAQRRARYANDPAWRQKQIDYTRDYNKAHPRKRDAFDNLYHAAWARSHPPTKAQRQRAAERHRHRYATDDAYRERYRANARERERRRQARIRAEKNQQTGVAA